MDKSNDIIIGELIGSVKSLIEDVKNLRGDIRSLYNSSEKEIEDLENRVQKLEKRQYTIVIIATALWTGILAWIKNWF